ncbi:hypothetical protein LKV13_03320 [Borrelia sp. BU AG58]|uniref:hypothetical protein n=1 Tax=Borrelia sp. BU AG58 TaxID=2887345 RepID=UPI001E4F3587|nr:hypothetical protein [Borrelia sp. BU AG58]UER67801.1 hypothetical protein LKV13_03320 [Borrelia sp. BU AG58]
MSESEFVFCIGYDGSRAIIDGELLRQHRDKGVGELFELGLYRSAFGKALYRKDDALIKYLIEGYNKISGSNYSKVEEFSLLYGVVYPDDISKIRVVYV